MEYLEAKPTTDSYFPLNSSFSFTPVKLEPEASVQIL